jgi:predicted pyridoxine 5'-phosphate oxidase superfamily flavin-nucleotide-binding protein
MLFQGDNYFFRRVPMNIPLSDIAFTPSVKSIQNRLGSRQQYAQMEKRRGWSNSITQELAAFLAEQDSFFLGTASADGRPYIQHRGGPKGFLKVLDSQTLAFADFSGNRQYVTFGNLAENEKTFIFVIDYASRTRIKLWGTAQVIEQDFELMAHLTDSRYKGQPERVIRFQIGAWDINCRQHIKRKIDEEKVAQVVQNLQSRVLELETEILALKTKIAEPTPYPTWWSYPL